MARSPSPRFPRVTFAPAWRWFALATVLLSSGGANCTQNLNPFRPPVPVTRMLPPTATLDDVVRVVNANSQAVQSLSTRNASISVPYLPALHANLAMERPRRFRLQADTAITGAEVDLGSNDELFWFWVKRNPSPSVYFCRHDQYAQSAAKSFLPVEPEWLIEAIGLPVFDPQGQHQGPYARNGKLEIHTRLETSQGRMTRIAVIDPVSGWVLGQHLYDAQGQRLASAVASRHERDPATAITLPQRIEIDWPATKFSMQIDLADLRINQAVANPDALWSLPRYEGFAPVDLADPRLNFPGQAPAEVQATYPERPRERHAERQTITWTRDPGRR